MSDWGHTLRRGAGACPLCSESDCSIGSMLPRKFCGLPRYVRFAPIPDMSMRALYQDRTYALPQATSYDDGGCWLDEVADDNPRYGWGIHSGRLLLRNLEIYCYPLSLLCRNLA